MKHSEILAHYAISAKKSLGQNFLVQDGILEKIANIVDIAGKAVVEVGPGYGALTEKLLALHPRTLTLVEYDPTMVRILRDRIATGQIVIPEDTEFTILEQDVLAYDLEQPAIIIANIPYYITSPILFRFFYETMARPTEMVILMQREVGDKIRLASGNKQSYFSLYCAHACTSVAEIMRVAPGNFIPAPKIESSVLHFMTREKENAESDRAFLKILSVGFLHPRKFLASNFLSGLQIEKAWIVQCFESLGISLQARPAELDLATWRALANAFSRK